MPSKSRLLTVLLPRLSILVASLFLGAGSALAAEALPQHAERVHSNTGFLTNSIVMVWLVAVAWSWCRPYSAPPGIWLAESHPFRHQVAAGVVAMMGVWRRTRWRCPLTSFGGEDRTAHVCRETHPAANKWGGKVGKVRQ